jgi:hypothetical protein
MIKDRIEELYSIFNKPRIYKKQKAIARKAIESELRLLGYNPIISKDKGIIRTNYNIMTECENPEYIICGHYDNPKMIMSRAMSYYSGKLSYGKKKYIFSIMFVLFYFALSMGINFLIYAIFKYNLNSNKMFIVYMAVLACMMCTNLFYPIYSADDNTSGVIAILLLADKLKDKNNKIQFVFFDNEEKGCKGSKAFIKNAQVNKNIKIINLDCVGRGKHIFIEAEKNNLNDKYIEQFMSLTNKDINIINESHSDCKSFSKNGYRAITLIRCDKARLLNKEVADHSWIHTKDDILANIDFNKIEEVIDLVDIYVRKDCNCNEKK